MSYRKKSALEILAENIEHHMAAQIVEARRPQFSGNVILLSDPLRKFPRKHQA